MAPLAGHVIGYAGRSGRMADGALQNNELLWPGAEGREGLEQTFDDQLQGKAGQLNISFDPAAKRPASRSPSRLSRATTSSPPSTPDLQRLCEQIAGQRVQARGHRHHRSQQRGHPRHGLLADDQPERLRPEHLRGGFKALQADPQIPLLPRAYRSAYPPGSTFKVAVGLAALKQRQDRPGG